MSWDLLQHVAIVDTKLDHFLELRAFRRPSNCSLRNVVVGGKLVDEKMKLVDDLSLTFLVEVLKMKRAWEGSISCASCGLGDWCVGTIGAVADVLGWSAVVVAWSPGRFPQTGQQTGVHAVDMLGHVSSTVNFSSFSLVHEGTMMHLWSGMVESLWQGSHVQSSLPSLTGFRQPQPYCNTSHLVTQANSDVLRSIMCARSRS